MLENTARPSQPPPPAAHRHVRQTDLSPDQMYSPEPVPGMRVAGLVLAVLLSGWMLAVPVALIDRLKDAPGIWAGTASVAIITCAVVTAGLAAFQLFNAGDGRRWLRVALMAALAATIAAAALSAILPEYGLLLLIPAVLAGIPGLVLLAKDARGS